MNAIIIDEKDVRALMGQLELKKFQLHGKQTPEDEMHRQFHYIVTNWLQEQGSIYPRF